MGISLSRPVLIGSSVEVLVIQGLSAISKADVFSEAKNLKEFWIGGGAQGRMTLTKDSFTGVAGKLNVYFYNQTKEEVIALAGNDEWFTNADKNVTFYFKDTIPAGTVIPEDAK